MFRWMCPLLSVLPAMVGISLVAFFLSLVEYLQECYVFSFSSDVTYLSLLSLSSLYIRIGYGMSSSGGSTSLNLSIFHHIHHHPHHWVQPQVLGWVPPQEFFCWVDCKNGVGIIAVIIHFCGICNAAIRSSGSVKGDAVNYLCLHGGNRAWYVFLQDHYWYIRD